MPVFPLVGSRIVSPGRSWPASSAARIIHTAGRSFTDPVGLRSSSLAHRRTSAEGDSRGNPTRGVPPQASSRLSNLAMTSEEASRRGDVWTEERSDEGRRRLKRRTSERARDYSAPSDGGEDCHRVAVGELGVEGAEEADILVVDVHVDEAVQRAVVGDETGAEARVAPVKINEQVGDGVAGATDGLLAAGIRAEDGRDANFDGHGAFSLSGGSGRYERGMRRSGATLVVDRRRVLPEHVGLDSHGVHGRIDDLNRFLG